MEEFATPNPKPNEFVIHEDQAYAWTDIRMSEIAEFLMTKLEPVNFETLARDDRVCPICQQEFQISDDVKLSHIPVKTFCGHIFGKQCIIKWLNPLCHLSIAEDAEPRIRRIICDQSANAKTSCPTCRRGFFLGTNIEPMELLAARLWFWDNAYALSGVARSEKEQRSRKYLWKYVKYYRSIDEFKIPSELECELLEVAQILFLGFANGLKIQVLTPFQERLRERLQRLGEVNLEEVINNAEDPLSYASYISYVTREIESDSESEEFVEEEENKEVDQPNRQHSEGSQ